MVDSFFVPEARRRLAGDAITGIWRARISRPEGTPDFASRPALLPEREPHAASIPAVAPQANIRCASSAQKVSIRSSNLLPRNIS